MGANPLFVSVPRHGAGIATATAETSRTSPTQVTTVLTGVAAPGTKIERVIVQGLDTTVAGTVLVFVYDNTTYHLYDEFLLPASGTITIAGASVVAPVRFERTYADLYLPSASYSLRIAQGHTTNVSKLKYHAFGGDLT